MEKVAIEQDTIKLLRECDAGIKMGVSSIDEVLPYVGHRSFRALLTTSKADHERLKEELQSLLDEYHDDGKDPNPMAKGMSWLKTNVKLSLNESDKTVADLMTDGCNMGVKSIHRYLNQYRAADERSKDLARRLADLEEKLTQDARAYL